jgi:N-ethylmaleimide reductase
MNIINNLHPIFQEFNFFDLTLKNRIVMAPLTRCRAGAGDVATSLQAQYYAQRSSAGLIISEASQISTQGKGYAHTPGIYTTEQIQGWKLCTDAVKEQNGSIFCQLWHVGRISHPDLQENNSLPVAPSAIKPNGFALTEHGLKPFVTPRALELNEIPNIIEQYRHAARSAKQAGFDGIEVHAANGYLLDQFLRDATNHRQDAYGGSIFNRTKLTIEIIEALCEIWPNHKIGIRLSPVSTFNDMADSTPFETFSYLIQELNRLDIAYIHCIEGTARDSRPSDNEFNFKALRKLFKNLYIANNLYDISMAKQAIEQDHADLICFGRPFISNPDLVNRFQNNLPLENAPKECWYGGGEKGYTDWQPYSAD